MATVRNLLLVWMLTASAMLGAARPASGQPLGRVVVSTRPSMKPASRPASQPASQPSAATRPAPETPDDCRALYMTGEYSAARKGYEKLLADDEFRLSAGIGLARVMAAVGDYAPAVKALADVTEEGADSARWRAAIAERLADVGRYEEALAHADRAVELKPEWAPAALVRGRLLETLGRREDALACYSDGADKALADDAHARDPRSLVAIGRILDRVSVLTARRASDQAQNILHNYFQQAYQRVDEDYWPANVAAGMFLLSKHRPQTAVQEFELAAKINPKVPEVFVGAGAAALDGWKFEQCLAQAEKALAINPRHPDALLLKATCLMQWRKFDQVAPVIEQVLAVNPNHVEALSLMAALYERTGEPDKASEYAGRVAQVDPASPILPNTIGEWLTAGRQYERAEEHFRRAIDLAPHLAGPVANLGLLYMQTGEEDRAREVLARAHEIDDFRADVVNYLRILRKLDDFEVRETDRFVVKVNGEYDAVLLDQIVEYFDEMYDEVCSDFSHRPGERTIVEIFPTHSQFSVRISGKGWIGTVGASTGPVIVMVAPDKERSQFGTYNWATVLRHEFAHTVTLSATRNRIPHWFTEACAVWQQPDRRNFEAVQRLVAAVRSDRLFPVKELDWGFIRPKRGGDRSLAYAQAEWMLEYIIITREFAAVDDMLTAFRDGKTQAEVFRDVLATSEADFDKAFATWAREQVKGWGFNPDPPAKLAEAAKAAKDNPDDPDAQAAYAKALLQHRRAGPAAAAARKALEIDPDNTTALAVLARVQAGRKQYDKAIETARRLDELDPDSVTAVQVLGQGHLAEQNWAEAIDALERYKLRMPLAPQSYEQLAKLYVQLGRPDLALPNLVELHRRTMKEPTYARQIADIYRATGRPDQALQYYRQIARINPYEVTAYRAMVEIHKNAGRHAEAVRAARWMTQVQSDSADAWTYLAAAQFHLARSGEDPAAYSAARDAAVRALELDPGAQQARELMGVIDASTPH